MNGAQLIADPVALAELAKRVQSSARVAIDTEFHNERTYAARLMVLQLAFEDGFAIVDPLAVSGLRPLADALQHTMVVGHALTSDLKIFADKFGAVPQDVFDTQVAASFLGYGMSISLADLVRDLCGVRLKKSQTVSDWSARPLSERQMEYLIDDVAHLLEMHDKLSDRLRASGRYGWAAEECRALSRIERYTVDERRALSRIPGSNRMGRRELGVLGELIAVRERVARERDVPLKYIVADDILGSLAVMRPKTTEELLQLRRLDAGTRRTLGADLLDAVRRGEAIPEDQLPKKFERPLGNSRETLVALMSVVVGEIARTQEMPASLLVPRASLERLAREVPADREGFERALDVSSWRIQLVGEPLWRLLSGSSTLRIEGYAAGDPRITVTS